jgi:SAM-dependent methyltransferase
MTTQSFKCPVCDGPADAVGQAIYNTREARFMTDMFHCRACDVYCRYIDHGRLIGHYFAASYVNLSNEERFLKQRKEFFQHLLLSIDKTHGRSVLGRSPVLVDFGCSYGHMLEAAQRHAYDAIGIELNEELVRYCRERGLNVQASLDEVPGPVDVFTLIDSLYCVPNPKEILTAMRKKLVPGGILVARVTNRNLYGKIRNFFVRDNDFSILGDCTVSYSHTGIRRLLASADFEIIELLPDSAKGKHNMAWKTWLLYKFSYAAYVLSAGLVNVSPGTIVLARPAQ